MNLGVVLSAELLGEVNVGVAMGTQGVFILWYAPIVV